jgi:hypothetical protein
MVIGYYMFWELYVQVLFWILRLKMVLRTLNLFMNLFFCFNFTISLNWACDVVWNTLNRKKLIFVS